MSAATLQLRRTFRADSDGSRFKDEMQLLGINCKYKRLDSHAIKVILNSIVEYEKAIKKLKLIDVKFFTHPIVDN